METNDHRPAPASNAEPAQLLELPGAMIDEKIHEVPIDALNPGDSPRSAGVDEEYAHSLANVESRLPPILVHRTTMTVVDGAHRVRAAQLRNLKSIPAQFVDADPDVTFVLAVAMNRAHGLPLSATDREASVERILRTYPAWSDRALAELAGISAKTVAAVRRRSTGDHPQLNARRGRDNRMRPVDASRGRRIASEVLRDKPDASLREVAAIAGVSPTTVRDVRNRMRQGEDPVPARTAGNAGVAEVKALPTSGPTDGSTAEYRELILELKKDPTLRYTQYGRILLRLLDLPFTSGITLDRLLHSVPPHRSGTIARLARVCAAWWMEISNSIESDDSRRHGA